MSLEQDLQDDFSLFTRVVWETSLRYTPYPIQLKTCEWLQRELFRPGADGVSRLGLFAQRDFGKTLIIGSLIDWLLYRDGNDTILVQSATQNHAKKIVGYARKMIEMCPLLQGLKPPFGNTWHKWGALEFDVFTRTQPEKDPSVAAYGIGSQVTGSHTRWIIGDDIEVPENSLTVEARDRLFERASEWNDIVSPKGGLGGIVNVGTFQSIDSVHLKITDKLKYRPLRIPAEYPDPGPAPDPGKRGGLWALAPWLLEDLMQGRAEAGDPTFPERKPGPVLSEMKGNPRRYALQQLLDPDQATGDDYPLKMRNLIVFDAEVDKAPVEIVWSSLNAIDYLENPGLPGDRLYHPHAVAKEYKPYQDSVMWVDPAGRGADEVGFAVCKLLEGVIWCPFAGGLEGGYEDAVLEKLAGIAHTYRVKRILVEPDWGDGMYTVSLRRTVQQTLGLKIGVEDAPKAARRGGKEQWICDVLEPVLGSHRLVISEAVARDTVLLAQLTHITRERGCLRHDDRVEALAGAVSVFTDNMHLDLGKLKQQRRLEDMQAELQEWERDINRGKAKPAQRSWLGTGPALPPGLRRLGSILSRSPQRWPRP